MREVQILSLLFISMALFFGMARAQADTTLVPVYPGAVRDRGAGDATVQVYLSKAPLSKVKAWYAAHVGGLNAAAGNTLWNADDEYGHAGQPWATTDPKVVTQQLGIVTMNQSKVVRFLKDMTLTRDAGVYCEGMQIKAPTQAADADGADVPGAAATMQAMAKLNQDLNGVMGPDGRKVAGLSELFSGLKDEVILGHHSNKELLAVYARYKRLETAWFPTVKTANGLQSYDRWLLAQDRRKVGEAGPASAGGDNAQDMQAMAAKAQAAAAAGDMNTLQAMQAQMMAAANGRPGVARAGKDEWKFWLGFLKDLDAHAYRTRIWVNTQPATWGF